MDVMVGYPDKWRDYSTLTIDADDLYGNVAARRTAFEWEYQLADLGKPVDRKKWGMTPQTVNAYNGGLENKIVFPAGILQAPFFDPNADAAVNYGAHRRGHRPRDQPRLRRPGPQVSTRPARCATGGRRRTPSASTPRPSSSATQYDDLRGGCPGMHVNGDADDGREHRRFRRPAWSRSTPITRSLERQAGAGDRRPHRRPALLPRLRARSWRDKQREDALRSQMTSDPHRPRRFRVIGPLPQRRRLVRGVSELHRTIRCTFRRRSARTSGEHRPMKEEGSHRFRRLPFFASTAARHRAGPWRREIEGRDGCPR